MDKEITTVGQAYNAGALRAGIERWYSVPYQGASPASAQKRVAEVKSWLKKTFPRMTQVSRDAIYNRVVESVQLGKKMQSAASTDYRAKRTSYADITLRQFEHGNKAPPQGQFVVTHRYTVRSDRLGNTVHYYRDVVTCAVGSSVAEIQACAAEQWQRTRKSLHDTAKPGSGGGRQISQSSKITIMAAYIAR